MAGYDGNGNFDFTYNWVNDAANGIPITASRMDTQFADAQGGFDLVICRDGQSTVTADIPFSGFKLTGVGAPTIPGDALIYGTTAANDVLVNAGKPCFLVRRTSNQSNVTGNGTLATVIWDGEIFDRGNNFAANQFVAPVTGIYNLCGSVLIGDLTAAMVSAQLQIVTTKRTYYFNAKDGAPLPTGTVSIQFAVDADLDITNTAYINVIVTGGAGDTADILGDAALMYSFFSGHLVA